MGFLGGDARMAYLARMLAGDGYAVKSWCLAGAPNESKPSEAMAAERIVLPAPVQKDGKLNGTGMPLGELWPRLNPGQRIYAGAVPETEKERAEALGLPVVDYFADETLAIRNAVPTAEGAIAAAMEHTSVTLCGAPCLVLGFGRVGKLLARRLAALGARTAVSARRGCDLAWIAALGYEPLHTERLAGKLGGFRVIFNTVPHMVLDGALLSELRPDCVLIELASRDGMNAAAAKAQKLDYVRAGGLPGKVAPESAALAIREALYRIWEEERE